MFRVLSSRNVLIRFLSLWAVGFTVMYVAWSISYRSLPEGVLCGKLLVGQVEIVTQELLSTFSRILGYNLVFACFPLVIANLVRVKRLPLGYLLVPYHWAMYGTLLGTNSFAFPSPSRLLPAFETLFRGVGICEITAYTLLAAATYGVTVYFSRGRFDLRIVGLERAERIGLAVSIALLAVSNFVEAWQIVR